MLKQNPLFPQINGILHGGDYNPEQWLDRPDILKEDIRLMKQAGINCATLGVFSWSIYEPQEGQFCFDWLVNIMDDLYANGIYTILATPSGAKPAWLAEKYPEVLRCDSSGVRCHHGVRHNHCMSSPIYREKVAAIIHRLYEAAGSHPGLLMWHISNEFGGECFCPLCVNRFQSYLADKFDHDIGKLNHAWWTTFWSHTYNDFSQIEPPYSNGEFSIMGLNLEWKRFTTWNMTDYMKSEIALLRALTPQIPVTTNFMELYEGLDYRVLAKELDVISWDCYPAFHNDYESFSQTMAKTAFHHAVMRSMKRDTPFMLMESAPGLVNWHSFNKMKRPGVHTLSSLQAVGLGSDTVQYFQWRKGRGSYEQYHGAVLDHLGKSDTRIFKEVAALGEKLPLLNQIKGSLVPAKAVLIYDWDTRWAIADMKGLADTTKRYDETCMQIYEEFLSMGIDMDVISQDMSLDGYQIVIAPMMYLLKPGTAERLKTFTAQGGQLMATYLTGYVDSDQLCFLGGFPGDGLSELFGVISEEIDTLYPADQNAVLMDTDTPACVRDYAEYLRTDDDVEVLGRFQSDYYAGMPAITRHTYEKGHAYYVAARIDTPHMKHLFLDMLTHTDIAPLTLPAGIQCCHRQTEEFIFTFYLNTTEQTQTIPDVYGYDLYAQADTDGSVTLEKYGIAIIRSKISD